jgi:hypothetical protein
MRGIEAHRRRVAPADITTVHGVPTTSPARTWFDLGRALDLPAHVAVGDSVLRAGTPRDDLALMVRDGGRQRGVVQSRAALSLLDGRARSRPESHLRVAVSGLRLPFQVNEPVHRDSGGWLAEPDLSLPQARLALEYQGSEHADVGRMRRDLTRFADLRGEGWLVLPYGPAEVFRRPWLIAAEVRAAVSTRRPSLLH